MSHHICLLLHKLLSNVQMLHSTQLHLDGIFSSYSLSTVDNITWVVESDREDSDFGLTIARQLP